MFRSKRRSFLQTTAAAAGTISVMDWLGWFRAEGVPGSPRDWGIATARAQAEDVEDRFLI